MKKILFIALLSAVFTINGTAQAWRSIGRVFPRPKIIRPVPRPTIVPFIRATSKNDHNSNGNSSPKVPHYPPKIPRVENPKISPKNYNGLIPQVAHNEILRQQDYLDAETYYNLGVRALLKGNVTIAQRCLRMAATKGHVDAQVYLGKRLYYSRDSLGILEGIDWLKKAARSENKTAIWDLYQIYVYDKDYRDSISAFNYLKKAVELKHPEALNDMGRFYYTGYMVEQNVDSAIVYFKKAADLNDKNACLNLYNIYRAVGENVDTVAAFEYLKKAAELKQSEALYEMGNYYYTGYMVEQDLDSAILYYEKAADLNEKNACSALYDIYTFDEGKRDTVIAYEYLKRAAILENPYALNNLGSYYLEGYMVEKDIDMAIIYYNAAIGKEDFAEPYWNLYNIYQFEEGHKDTIVAFEYLKKAVELGNPYALNNLGLYYQEGYMVEKDIDMAIGLFKTAIDKKYFAEPYWNLYNIYQYDEDHRKIKAAYGCLWNAANLGYADAKNVMGVCYELGYMVDKDICRALGYYNDAAEKGCSSAYSNLGRVLSEKKNKKIMRYKPDIAAKVLQMGADKGYAECQYLLGMAYKKGCGVEKNQEKARRLLNLAANNGIKSEKDLEINNIIYKKWAKDAKNIEKVEVKH